MAKRGRPPKRPQEEPGKRTGRSLNSTIDPAIAAVLEAFVDETKPRTTKTAVVELALMEFFERIGRWPPKKS